MEVGVYGVHFPPFELATGAAVGAEAGGMDFITYGDQPCLTNPTSMWTPDITDVATLLSKAKGIESTVAGLTTLFTERLTS